MADVNRLFAQAEQAYLAGRADEARAALTAVRRLAGDQPKIMHLLGLVEARRGDRDAAASAFEAALRSAPKDAALHGSFAAFLVGVGNLSLALEHHGRAVSLAPNAPELRYNRALLLQKMGHLAEALIELDRVIAARPGDAKAHSARGGVLRALGRLKEAAAAYDTALQREPRRLPTLFGRATIAKERGEEDAPARYRAALALRPGDPQLVLGLAEALELVGDPEAISVLEKAVAEQPEWIDGQSALARMRSEAGEGAASTRDLERATSRSPRNRELWIAWVAALGGSDRPAEAADVAARGREALGGDDAGLMLREAVQASEAGQIERADRLFASLPAGISGRARMEMRHRVRCGDYPAAAALGEQARAESPWDVATWAMTGLLWRLTGDPRTEWLLGQSGLVDARPLPLTQAELGQTADRLRRLHTGRAHPPGQSLRGGTQTRGLLFEREEPEIVRLRDAILQVVTDYWEALPPGDPTHPLLRLRHERPRIAGSWSVRLTDGGFHIAHYHPHGALSSACYLVVPEPRAPMEGWLEIGGPPGGMDVPIDPFRRIEPAPGLMALFPSFFFHGTRPFAEGERLTVAFDVVAG